MGCLRTYTLVYFQHDLNTGIYMVVLLDRQYVASNYTVDNAENNGEVVRGRLFIFLT